MDTLLLLIVVINVACIALCALGIARQVQRSRSNFDDERADQA